MNLYSAKQRGWQPDAALREQPAPMGQAIEASTGEQIGLIIESSEEQADRGLILLADDNPANVLTIGEYLESKNFQVVVAHTGLEAIVLASELNPNIILMDIHMPVMDGLEAIRHLRTDPRFRSVPIIALTALAMPGDRERCQQAYHLEAACEND